MVIQIKLPQRTQKSNLEQITGQTLQDNQKSTDKTWKQLGYTIDIKHGDGEHTSNEFKAGEEICVSLNWTNDQVQNVGVALRKKSGELYSQLIRFWKKYRYRIKRLTTN